jgi:RNA polymerase sigma-70 factor (ECF subfamily)
MAGSPALISMQNATRSMLNHGGSAIPSLRLVEVAEKPNEDATFWRMDPDVVTMERLRDGDVEAFQVLFVKYSRAIAKFAYCFLRSRDRAEEVAQSVFLNLFRARERYQPKARFATFLYQIATNLCLNELRRFDYSGKIESLDVTDDPDGSSFADHRLVDTHSPGPAQRLACREAATEIIKVLKRLPSNQRRALLLSRVDGFSYREVANSLDSSTGAVKSLIFRAAATLRRDLAEIL